MFEKYSQGRGLELIMPALYKFKEKVELHLIGNLYSEFYEKYLSAYKDIVTIHKPLVQKELNLKLSKFDVGLAIELDTADFNRQICLTNKIWAYLQSGLYILATDTPAQVRFLEEHKDCGQITKQNSDAFSDKIADINQNISKIRQSKQERFENAKQFSWENESEKLTEIWHKILK
jgi:glycosyltransferase involved in cell wall biosynthesis